jgi:Lrp/AsnC family transcriptional regulator
MEKTVLDRFDCGILRILQRDTSLPVEEIAAKIGLSPSPCWRRIKALEAKGFIRSRVALLDRRRLNVDVTVFVAVRTNQHTTEWSQRFAKIASEIPEVVEFYRMSGHTDYLMKIIIPDIAAYDSVYKRLIDKIPMFDVTSMFAMEQIKFTTEIPLGYAAMRKGSNESP